jgi:hypothetical protein
MSMPDNTGKSDTEPDEKAEAPTASFSAKPAVATSQGGAPTIEKLRTSILIACGIGFFYALLHSLNISLTHDFWWSIIAIANVFTFVIWRRRAK